MIVYEIFIAQPGACKTICAPHHRKTYKRGEGPHPPLHPHCRCKRIHKHVEVTPINERGPR